MFVDRMPSPPVVTFTYVDAGAVTLEAFGMHLRAYLGLFQALQKLEFIYVAPTARLFQAAPLPRFDMSASLFSGDRRPETSTKQTP
jgi:hypothetical protein